MNQIQPGCKHAPKAHNNTGYCPDCISIHHFSTMELNLADRQPVPTTLRVRPGTRILLDRLKRELNMSFVQIVHIALRLLEAQIK